MRAVTFQAPGEVRVEERPDPELLAEGDTIVRVTATSVCGSDLHIYHGRVAVEPGFTLGHEFAGTVVAAAPGSNAAVGDAVLGCFQTACGHCFFCRRSLYHKCENGGVFGHGSALGALQGAQAEMLRVPHSALVLRHIPEGMPDGVALLAGDVLATGYHAVAGACAPGDVVAVLGLGPVGLCAVQVARAAGAAAVIAVDSVEERLAAAERAGAVAVHLERGDPRAAVRRCSEGRGADLCVDAVGHPAAFDLALRLVRNCGTLSAIGVYTERAEVHLGLLWFKGITLRAGQANAIAHVDAALALLASRSVDPAVLLSGEMALEEAPQAYRRYDRREVLKLVLRP